MSQWCKPVTEKEAQPTGPMGFPMFGIGHEQMYERFKIVIINA
jgi:hypothetical protein